MPAHDPAGHPSRDSGACGDPRRLHAVRVALPQAEACRKGRGDRRACAAAAARAGDASLHGRAGPGRRRQGPGHRLEARGHVRRHRAAIQRRLYGARARKSGSRSMASGRGHGNRAADRVHTSGRAARGHRAEPRADAPLLFPEAEEGRPVEVITHPIGIGKVGWATPEGTTKVVSHVKDPTWTPPVSVRKEHAKDGDILPATVPPGTGQSARPPHDAARLAELPDARHEQATCRRHARERRLRPALSRGHRAPLRCRA